MATKQFLYNTNVGISENYSTNFFDISSIQITAATDLDITKQELCAEVLAEMASIYIEIDTFSQNNIDQENMFTFSQKLVTTLQGLRPRYLKTMSFFISNLDPSKNSNLSVIFDF